MGTQGRRITRATTGIQLNSKIWLMFLLPTVWARLSFKASNISFPEICADCGHLQGHYQRGKDALSGSAAMHLGPDFHLTNLFGIDSLSGDLVGNVDIHHAKNSFYVFFQTPVLRI